MDIIDRYVQVNSLIYNHETENYRSEPFICRILFSYKEKGTTVFVGLKKDGELTHFQCSYIMKIFGVEPDIEWIEELEKRIPLQQLDI